ILQNFQLVARVLVEANLADPEDVGTIQKIRDKREHIFGQLQIFRLFRIQTEPAEMWQSELRGSTWLVFSKLGEIIVKALRGTPVVSSPKGRFANCRAACRYHCKIVIRRAADHVAVWFDIAHVLDQIGFGGGAPAAA